jgi:paraquat-inducible protein B
MEVSSLQSLLQGGIAYDSLGTDLGSAAKVGRSFPLFSSEQKARLSPEPLKITFDDGQGLLAGQTQVRYLGIPIGLVEEVHIKHHRVEVTAYLAPGYDVLRKPDTSFSIVHPKLRLDGLSGIETLVSGVYIECIRPTKSSKRLVHFMDRMWKRVIGEKMKNKPSNSLKLLLENSFKMKKKFKSEKKFKIKTIYVESHDSFFK